jgi:hypothetical protein
MALASEDLRVATLEEMLSGHSCVTEGIVRQSLRREKIKGLRYCDECEAECRDAGIESHYRVDQQLAGVYVCPRHGGLLRLIAGTDTIYPYRSGSLATSSSSKDRPTFEKVKGIQLQAMADVARRSAHELTSPSSNVKNFPYRDLLKEAGLLSRTGFIRRDALVEACSSYVGDQFCAVTGFDDACIRRILSPEFRNAQAHHPFKTLALQSMLSYWACYVGASYPCVEQRPVALNEPLICSGKLHRDADGFGDMRFGKTSGRYIADCTCGISITFRIDSDRKLYDHRVIRFGPRYETAFRKLVRGGMTAIAAGKKIGIANGAAGYWMRAHLLEAIPLSKSCRMALRAEWRACVESAPAERRLRVARQRNLKLYAKLKIHDNGWLQDFNSRNRGSRGRSDADRRELRRSLDVAREVVVAKLPPERVTCKALIAVARCGPRGRLPGELDPAVKQYMLTLLEEKSAFVDRQIDYWLEELAGESIASATRFLSRCRLYANSLDAAQRARISDWLQSNHR